MNTPRIRSFSLVAPLLLATLAGCAATSDRSDGEGEPGVSTDLALQSGDTGLRRRVPAAKPKTAPTKIETGFRTDTMVLKFAEGTHIRRRDGKFVFDAALLTKEEQILLQRNGLDAGIIGPELGKVDGILAQQPKLGVISLVKRDEQTLANEKLEGELTTAEELADLGLYFLLGIEDGKAEQILPIINQLNTLKIVEIAYAQPMGQNAAADIAPATMNFESRQGYVEAAPGGLDARFAWGVAGGDGAGVKVVDIETGWLLEHEDLDPVFYRSGLFNPFENNHGTAVLGVVSGRRNGYGMSGMAPAAATGVATPAGRGVFEWWSPAGAIDDAARNVSAGDVVLIEQHYPGPNGGRSCDTSCGNCGQFAYVAVENFQAEFDVIRAATARNIIVVEAAGNGQMDLDGAQFEGRFNRAVRDSGALMVGAGNSWDHAPACWGNAGARVDVHAWGDSVFTSGYGDVRAGGDDARQFYTMGFSGTSSASAIIAGGVASLQGSRVASGFGRLTPQNLRTLLRSTGTPQAASSRNIGPQPNLRAAIEAARNNPTVTLHTVTTATRSGYTHSSRIDEPHANVNPGAVLVVTQQWNPLTSSVGTYNDHPVGVWYDGSRWQIYNEDLATLPINASFSVSINEGFTHTAMTAATRTVLNHASVNGLADRILVVTHNYGNSGPYLRKSLVTRYDAAIGRWTVETQDGTAIPAGAKINVAAFAPGPFDFRQVATTTSGHTTDVRVPLAITLTPTLMRRMRLFITPVVSSSTPAMPGNYGVYWQSDAADWALFDEGFRAMPTNGTFAVHAAFR